METLDVFTQGLPSADRTRAEAVLRDLMTYALKDPAELRFVHADSLNGEVDISVPKLNGELRFRESQLLEQIVSAIIVIVGKVAVVTCRMRETHNELRRW